MTPKRSKPSPTLIKGMRIAVFNGKEITPKRKGAK